MGKIKTSIMAFLGCGLIAMVWYFRPDSPTNTEIITGTSPEPKPLPSVDHPVKPALKDKAIAAAAKQLPLIGVSSAPAKASAAVSVPRITLDTTSAQKEAELVGSMTPPAFIMSMCLGLQGNLWVGSEDEGVCRYDPSTKRWTRFTTKDGLGDDNGYAVACDRRGRIWAGQLNHGVCVYNGERWQCYEPVGGLSRADTLSGPLGERVFAIKVCPTDGDVWIASSAGLARYSESKDDWSYYTRADGLPSDQANAIAFDEGGNIYVGTQCDGIAMSNSSSAYKTWRTVTGPDRPAPLPTGDGLPCSLINDLLISKDGTVYAATTMGLAWSKDHGQSWRYVRGADWLEKVKYQLGERETRELDVREGWLAEDYLTCLAEDQHGMLLVGYRKHGCERLDIHSRHAIEALAGSTFVRAIMPTSVGALVGTYGTDHCLEALPALQGSLSAAEQSEKLPAAAPPSAVLERGSDTQPGRSIAYVGEDWATQGDWVGRYGRQHNLLCAMMSPMDHRLVWDRRLYELTGFMGPHHRPQGDNIRAWLQAFKATSKSALYDPIAGCRRQGEYDDHGEAYSESFNGPDLWFRVIVPAGIHRISLYFVNHNGHGTRQARRDFLLSLYGEDANPMRDNPGPVLARARVLNFFGGCYKEFCVDGPGKYTICVSRNSSLNAMCSAIFADRVRGPVSYFDALPLPWLGDVHIEPRQVRSAVGDNPSVTAAIKRWEKLDGVPPKVIDERISRMMCYRAAISAGVPHQILESWRWKLSLWTNSDRERFAELMDNAWAKQIKITPEMVWEDRQPLATLRAN